MLVTFGREATNELRERVRERLVGAERALADPGAARAGSDQLLASARRGRRRGGRPPPGPARHGAGRLRRGDHRHHPPVLPADAGRAGGGRRHRPAGGVHRVRGRPAHRGGRRLLRAQVRRPQHRSRRCSPGPRRSAWPAGRCTTGRRGWSRRTPSRAASPRCGTGSRPRCGRRWRGASRRGGSTPTTTCSPGSTTRWPTRRRGGSAAAAGPLPRRAGRRVPGHRPGAVGDPAARLRRRRAADGGGGDAAAAHGHPVTLVLIGDPKQAIYAFRGARRAQLPRRHRGRRPARHAWPATGAATRRCSPRWTRCSAGPRSATRASSCTRWTPPTRDRRLRGAPVDTPLRLRVVPRGELPRTGRDLAVVGPARERVAADVAADVAGLLASPAQARRPAGAARRRRGAGAHQRPGQR